MILVWLNDLGMGAGGTAAAADFRQSVAYALGQISGLTAVVGTRIYWADPSQRAIYPNCCLKCTHLESVKNLGGEGGVKTGTVEITIQSNLPAAVSALVAAAKAIYDSLAGFRGYQNGCPWMWCLYDDDESDDSVAPPDGSPNWIYSLTVVYRIRHRVPLPANVTQTNV